MTHEALTGIALVAVAVIYGTDVFCALVQRSAMKHVTDEVLTQAMGYVHLYGDQRLKLPGAVGLLATLASTVTAVATNAGAAAIGFGGTALLALVVWFAIYGRVSKPVNTKLIEAAQKGHTPADSRALQHTWDSVINPRAGLQGSALLLLYLSATIN